MRRITRYILLDFFKIFLIALTGLTAVMILAVVGQEAIRKGLSPVNVVRMLPYAVPIALVFAIPGTTLFAACSVYGRMSAENEVVAVKSLGISPMALIWPVLTASFLLSLLVVGLNDIAVSWGRDGLKRVVLESVEQIAYGMLRAHGSYSTSRFSIYVRDVDGHRLIGPTLTFHGANNGADTVVIAEEAELRSNPAKDALSISLTNWEGEAEDSMRVVWPDNLVIDVPLSDPTHQAAGTGRPSDIALRRISWEIAHQQATIEKLEQTLASQAAYQMLTGEFQSLTNSDWASRHASLEHARSRLHRLFTEPWRRWANGFSCFAFVLVGAPLAIRMRNSDVWTSFAVCFLPILMIYYPLLAYGVTRAKSGAMPAYCVWLGNVVLLAAGWWLVKKVARQ